MRSLDRWFFSYFEPNLSELTYTRDKFMKLGRNIKLSRRLNNDIHITHAQQNLCLRFFMLQRFLFCTNFIALCIIGDCKMDWLFYFLRVYDTITIYKLILNGLLTNFPCSNNTQRPTSNFYTLKSGQFVPIPHQELQSKSMESPILNVITAAKSYRLLQKLSTVAQIIDFC